MPHNNIKYPLRGRKVNKTLLKKRNFDAGTKEYVLNIDSAYIFSKDFQLVNISFLEVVVCKNYDSGEGIKHRLDT